MSRRREFVVTLPGILRRGTRNTHLNSSPSTRMRRRQRTWPEKRLQLPRRQLPCPPKLKRETIPTEFLFPAKHTWSRVLFRLASMSMWRDSRPVRRLRIHTREKFFSFHSWAETHGPLAG